jgi:hypothetical protein
MRADPLPGPYIIFAVMAILCGRVLIAPLTATDSGLFPGGEEGRRKIALGATILERV